MTHYIDENVLILQNAFAVAHQGCCLRCFSSSDASMCQCSPSISASLAARGINDVMLIQRQIQIYDITSSVLNLGREHTHVHTVHNRTHTHTHI